MCFFFIFRLQFHGPELFIIFFSTLFLYCPAGGRVKNAKKLCREGTGGGEGCE